MKFLIGFCAIFNYFIFSVKGSNNKNEVSGPIYVKSVEVAALGRTAYLGDLYDATEDRFVDVSIYASHVPRDAVQIIDIGHSSIDYVRNESQSEKMEKLGVSPSLSLSLMAGLVKVSGAAKYLKEDKKRSTSAKSSLVYSVRTARENLNIFSKSSKESIDRFLLQNIYASHVVIGVVWGADAVLSLEEISTDSSYSREIRKKLETALKSIAASAFSPSNQDFINFDLEKSNTFSISLNSDIISYNFKTINQSIAFLKTFPKLIEKLNNGKGKIVKYILMPLATVRNVFQSKNTGVVVKDIDPMILKRFCDVFEEIKSFELRLNDIYNDMNEWAIVINENDLTFRFDSPAKIFREGFAEQLLKVRNGTATTFDFKHLRELWKTGDWDSTKFKKFSQPYKSARNKITIMTLLENINASFLSPKFDKNNILASNYDKEFRLISVNLNMDISSPTFHNVFQLLKTAAKKKSNAVKYYIEDRPDLQIPLVEVYFQGSIINSFYINETGVETESMIPINESSSEMEYLILISSYGIVSILDATSFALINSFNEPKLYDRTVAIVKDEIYNINTLKGEISSTNIRNLIALPENGIIWKYVDSFQGEPEYLRSVAAVNGSSFYFVSYGGILYKYDTELKQIRTCAILVPDVGFYSLIIVNGIIYIYARDLLFSYNGESLTDLETPDARQFPVLFEFQKQVCCVGGDRGVKDHHPTYCYNPDEKTWTIVAHNKDARWFAGIAKTSSGTVLLGGKTMHTGGEFVDSAEIFNPDTSTWNYVKIPSAVGSGYYSVITFRFQSFS